MKKINVVSFALIFILLSLLISLPSNIFAYSSYPSGHIGLLTVSESKNNTERGGVADLYLEVRPGTGKIFIDSFPLSKIDTQITFRFANEIACDLLDKDCSNYDFFYTITANSAVVGGPSAGAAATVLTVAVLDNQKLDEHTIMTGTINSGNLVGPVSGVYAKSLAAEQEGYGVVLIPKWDLVNETSTENLSIKIIPIVTLEEALYYFTGKDYAIFDTSYVESSEYSKDYDLMMSKVTIDLCTKYGSIRGDTVVLPNLSSYNISVANVSNDNFIRALNAMNNDSYYSAASFCFGGNVKIHHSLIKNLSNDDLKIIYVNLFDKILLVENNLTTRDISTISELETYMIVVERLYEAKSILKDMDLDNLSSYELAYASERLETAIIWSRFFDLPGQKYFMDDDLLKIVCSKKLSEAEERLNYLELYYPDSSIREELSTAYSYYASKDYELCIFTASKIKADSDVVLSAIFVPENNLEVLFNEKISAARRVIAKQAQSDVFPIMGYSYYEYALSLKDTDLYSALLYAEYSLELSNIDMYFEKKDVLNLSNAMNIFDISFNRFYALGFISGILLSIVVILISLILMKLFFKKNKSNSISRKNSFVKRSRK